MGTGLLGGGITYVHAPTGVVATDKVVLSDAVADTADGGIVQLVNGGDTPYATDQALTIDKNLTFRGAGVSEVGFNANGPSAAPWLRGSVILQTAAATDGIKVTGKQKRVNLADFGIVFDTPIRFSNTGHGINTEPAEIVGGGHGIGLMDSLWENVFVFGHDGNHYGRRIVNALLNTYINMRAYGGGLVEYVQDSTVIISGNTVDIHPYGCLLVAGTAHAYAFSAITASGGGGGALNLFTFIRPQVNTADYSADATYGNPATPTTSQYMWQVAAGAFEAIEVSVIDPDFEADDSIAHPVNFGTAASGNVVRGGGIISTAGTITNLNAEITGARANTMFGVGPNALVGVTSGTGNTGVGIRAGQGVTSGSNVTAVGQDALAAGGTGANNTAVGYQALKLSSTGNNTAVGTGALQTQAASGANNTAVGANAMASSTGANNNVAVGQQALQSATQHRSVALGAQALASQTSASDNIAIGYGAGVTGTSANATTTGSQQVVIGTNAGQASTTQRTGAIAVGYQALVDGNNAIAVGSGASAGAAGAIAIGKDSAGTSVATTVQDQIALGTASHHILLKTAAAPTDASLAASQFTLWLDATNGAAKLMIKAKQADGTVKTAAIALA